MEGMLAPTLKSRLLPHYRSSRSVQHHESGARGRCYGESGKVRKRSDKAHLIRDGIVIFTGELSMR